jgi:hypothetical protein
LILPPALKHQAIDIADGNPLGRPTPQHIELMPKGENFGLQACARPEQPGHGVPDQLEEIAHRRDYRPIRRRSTAVLGFYPVNRLGQRVVFLFR